MVLEIKCLFVRKFISIVLAVIAVGLVLSVSRAQAAEFRFNPAATQIHSGDEFAVAVILDAANADINTIEGTLEYPADQLELKEVRLTNSVVTFWIQQPAVGQNGRVPFAGSIVGGYVGTGGTVFVAVFSTPRQDLAEDLQERVTVSGAKGYLNDGLGTPINITTRETRVTIQPHGGVASATITAPEDTTVPEPFTIEVAQDPAVFENKWFVAFSAEDKQTGIAYYEIQESSSLVPDDTKWQRTQSPYVLSDQSRRSYVHVRAVDYGGNVRVATLAPGTKSVSAIYYGIAAVLIVMIGLGVWWWHKRRKDGHAAHA